MITNIRDLCVSPETKVMEILKAIDRAGSGSTKAALIVNEEGKLLGLINDGDIRRALLKKSSLDQCAKEIMNDSFVSVHESATRSSVLDIMRSRCINLIPALNNEGRVVGLHSLRDFVNAKEVPNVAVVMAGGRGTRLHPLTENVPKPMVRVAGTPILEHIVHHLVGSGIKKIFLSVNYMADMIQQYFEDGTNFGCSIEYLVEDKPLGTAGALSLLPKINEDFLLMNGDLITQFDFRAILEKHQSQKNTVTVGVRDYLVKIPYGVLQTEGDLVVDVKEKPQIHNLVNAAVYILSPSILERVPVGKPYLATEIIENCLADNDRVGYHLLEEDWIDIGEHEQLSNARGVL